MTNHNLFRGLDINIEVQEKILRDAEIYKGLEVIPDELYVGDPFSEGEVLTAFYKIEKPLVTLLDIRYIEQPSEYIDVYWDIVVPPHPEWNPEWDLFMNGCYYEVDRTTGELVSFYHYWKTDRQIRKEAEQWKKWKEHLSSLHKKPVFAHDAISLKEVIEREQGC